ncbi:MAG: hypothetical protein H0X24_12085 [Ktedonobacterales bacterium]|nr:hypothetical protein [Ktedonobacterales bacterium]
MLFGIAYIYTHGNGSNDIAIDIGGFRHRLEVDADSPYIRRSPDLALLAARNAQITIVSATMDQEINDPHPAFPGGTIVVAEFYEGALRLVDNHWVNPDGSPIPDLPFPL